MIPVDRGRIPRPPSLDLSDPDSAASKELKKAKDYYADPANHSKPKYEAYKSDEVKLALFELFQGKCAYCETDIGAANAQDIEHYRPKGQIDPGSGQALITPGYYWLAAEWDNLLLSCPGCNRRQRQRIRDADGHPVFEEEATGKLDQFPLREGVPRALNPEIDLSVEEPGRLLLNPCLDQPDKFLRYDHEGNVLPRTKDGNPREEAVRSIEVYQLKRFDLAGERRGRYLEMKKVEVDIELSGQMVDRLDPADKDLIAASIRAHEERLLDFTDDGKPYAGMCRWHMRKFKRLLKKVKEKYEVKFREPV